MKIVFGVKEWAAVVESLGNGYQSIMVRSDTVKPVPLLLYPTWSYAKSKHLSETFQGAYVDMAEICGREAMQEAHTDTQMVTIRYFVRVTDTIQVTEKLNWDLLEPYFIWSKKHVSEYARTRASVNIWLVRAYKLSEPIQAQSTNHFGSMTSYVHHADIFLKPPPEPILGDVQFERIRNEILAKTPSSAKRKVLSLQT